VAIRPILLHPAPRLRAVAPAVETFDDGLARLVEDLVETLRAHGAIGLSAPQIDEPRRVCVIETAGDGRAPQVFVNPVIVRRGRAYGFVQESCLSVPGVAGNVWRDTRVTVRAQDPDGRLFERGLEGMDAVALQHEIDHLDGMLFIDRLSPLRRVRMWLAARAAKAEGLTARRA